ncbi:hypothetical protein K491DRAFT_781782 [Lophiostoma macrostomum CBS 122681]|uniref:Heterokaryon incompatibility domain-containing protein n=1 Tax=Lophiostoma macrostomum CBS 122681 TaxID=1314788 RepID=A0A6A6SVE8_9PLEO|nr:hypothetical protein K491DRAFT_781782 [Lophiostoma macrostomum CBS 122681]
MDHLPIVNRPHRLQLTIPCLCDPHDYDGLGFEGFSRRRGWRLEPQPDPTFKNPDIIDPLTASDLSRYDGLQYSDLSAAAFAQSWLFFGLLHEVLALQRIHFDPLDYVVDSGQGYFITTTHFAHVFETWTSQVERHSFAGRENRAIFRAVQNYLITSLAFLCPHFTSREPLPGHPVHRRIRTDTGAEVSLFTTVDFLDWMSRCTRFPDPFASRMRDVDDTDTSISLKKHLESIGWCKSELSLMALGFDNTTCHFAGALYRQSQGLDHSVCSSIKCLARQVIKGGYRTNHAEGCQGCVFLRVDEEELAHRVCTSPLVNLCIDVPAGEYLDANTELKFTSNVPYVAISHVWSDGLGNEQANSLPLCQLRRLRRLVDDLSQSRFCGQTFAIWVDTLAVAVHHPEARRNVLVRLVQIYQDAAAVLVLDDDLQRTPVSCSLEEKLVRIGLSGWTRRLWTLEEGMAASRHLVFQFLGGVFSIPSADSLPIECNTVARCAHLLYHRLLPDQHGNYSSGSFWNSLLFSITYRSTSRRSDEPICFSHIFGLDVSGLVKAGDADERMRLFYDLLARAGIRFPARLLFTRETKLQITGYRWAPSSFLELSGEDISALHSDILTEDKLSVTLDVGGGLRIPSFSRHHVHLPDKLKDLLFCKVGVVWYVMAPRSLGLSRRLKRGEKHYSSSLAERLAPELQGAELDSQLEPLVNACASRDQELDYQRRSPPLALICEGQGDMSSRGLIAMRRGYDTSTQPHAIKVEAIMPVDILELEARGKNLVVQGVTGPILGFSADMMAQLGVEMDASFQRYFDPAFCSVATLTQMDNDQQLIVM